MSNVQLQESERSCVYISTLTGRILGFGPECMTPMYKESWTRTVLYHAKEMDLWFDKYRAQEEEDFQGEQYQTSMREAPARRAIRAALVERNKHVDGFNRRMNDVQIALLDQREERAQKRKQIACSLSEMYDSSVRSEDIALDSPAFKEG